MQFQSARKDGRAVVRETSTYMTDVDAQQFCEFFAEGLDSGLGYARIIGFLERKGTKANVIQSLRKALLEEGTQLSEAFARYGLLDATGRKLVLVAETQGTLPELLNLQAKNYRDRYERKKELVFGIVEPLVMAVIAFGGLVPIIKNLEKIAAGANSVWMDAFLTALGPLIVSTFALIFYFILSYVWLSLPVDMPLRETGARLFMRLPVLSYPGRLNATSVFCRYLYTSVRSGLNIYEGLFLAAEASNDPSILGKIQTALEYLEQGHSLERSLAAAKSVPSDVIDYVGMGEETGRLEEMLIKCADIYKQRAHDTFQKYLTVVIYIFRIILIVTIIILAMGSLLDKFGEVANIVGGI